MAELIVSTMSKKALREGRRFLLELVAMCLAMFVVTALFWRSWASLVCLPFAAFFLLVWLAARRSRGPEPRIVLDVDRRLAVFENFVVRPWSERFWNLRAEIRTVVCRFDDIMRVWYVPDFELGVGTLRVLTKQGRLNVDWGMTHFDQVRQVLQAAARGAERRPIPLTEQPLFWVGVILFSMVLVMAVGYLLG